MPPKVRITKEDIVSAAVDIVRSKGETALNARNIAAVLCCSTQPVFSNFATMEELRVSVVEAADTLFGEYMKREIESGRFPPYKASGMAYIRFAKEEKELFKLLFMRDRSNVDKQPNSDYEAAIELLMKANGISRSRAELMHLEVWACVHGIATMLATSFQPLEWELISDMLTDVYQGVRARHLREEK